MNRVEVDLEQAWQAFVLRVFSIERCLWFSFSPAVIVLCDVSVGNFLQRQSKLAGDICQIPQEVAERGPLLVELLTVGGDTPPSHLPEDLGLGVDWLEVSPMSRGAILLPTAGQWFRLFLFLLLGFFFLRFLGIEPFTTAVAILTLVVVLSAMAVLYPVTTSQTLVFAWFFFPVVMLLLWIAELADRRSSPAATREAIGS